MKSFNIIIIKKYYCLLKTFYQKLTKQNFYKYASFRLYKKVFQDKKHAAG